MTIDEIIRQEWGWTGLVVAEIVDQNAFGNLLVRDPEQRVWRICPELLSCEVVAADAAAYAALRRDDGFAFDWAMQRLVELARRHVGQLAEGHVYCFKVPPALGAEYDEANMASLALGELIGVTGNIAFQIRDLPPGTQVEIKIVD